jgi:hypothetical protein
VKGANGSKDENESAKESDGKKSGAAEAKSVERKIAEAAEK